MLSRRKWKFDPSRIKDQVVRQTIDGLGVLFGLIVILPAFLLLGLLVYSTVAVPVIGIAADIGYFFYSIYWLVRHVPYDGWTHHSLVLLIGLILEPIALIILINLCQLGGQLISKFEERFERF